MEETTLCHVGGEWNRAVRLCIISVLFAFISKNLKYYWIDETLTFTFCILIASFPEGKYQEAAEEYVNCSGLTEFED